MLSLLFIIPAHSAGCKYGDVVICTTEAKKGDTYVQNKLGDMYFLGHGVIKDYKQAYMLFNIASTNGDENTNYNRDILEKKMASSQISKAQELSEEWIAKHSKK